MGFYSDLMGFYSDLMGFYSDLMGYIIPLQMVNLGMVLMVNIQKANWKMVSHGP